MSWKTISGILKTYLRNSFTHVGGVLCHVYIGLFQSLHFLISSAFASSNYSTSVTHASPRRRCQSSDESCHRLRIRTLNYYNDSAYQHHRAMCYDVF